MTDAKDLYLGLLKACLTNRIYGDVELRPVEPRSAWKRRAIGALERRGLRVVRPEPVDWLERELGHDPLPTAHTMIGMARLDNLQVCIEAVLADGTAGDLIETGVWRGGATIFMRGVLKAHGVTGRAVWVADSFQGLPPPDDEEFPQDAGDIHHTIEELAVSLKEVTSNFERYGLLDEQVRFLPGWFRDTLPDAPIEQLAVVRLDGDMYGSTMTALRCLYPKLSIGGFLIVDDYGIHSPGCRRAVNDFRAEHGIREELRWIDWSGVFWQRIE